MTSRVRRVCIAFSAVLLLLSGCADNLGSTYTEGKIGWLLPPEHSEVYLGQSMEFSSGFSEGLLSVAATNASGSSPYFGYIDPDGVSVIGSKFLVANNFSNGFAAVMPSNASGSYGYIDNTGELVIPAEFQRAGDFSANGLAAVCKAGAWGYIDKTGAYAVAPMYKYASDFCDGVACVSIANSDGSSLYYYINASAERLCGDEKHFIMAAPFSEGLACAWDGDNYADALAGYLNTNGEWAIEPKYKSVGSFSEGLAFALDSDSGLYGYINTNGEWVVSPSFAYAGEFSDSLAMVGVYTDESQNTIREGYIDKTGKLVIPAVYHSAQPFKNGYASVTLISDYSASSGVRTIIDRNGNEYRNGEGLLEEGCALVGVNYGDLAIVMKDGLYGLFRFKPI